LRRAVLGFLLVLVAAVDASPAHAFDGRREGFMLGFGAGYGGLDAPQFVHDNASGIATRLEIGVGLSDRWMVHYAGKQVLDLGEDGHVQLLPMVGVTHYLKSDAGSLLLTAGGGVSLLAEDGQENFNGGSSLFVGAGYEFARHWNVEVDYVNSFDTAATTHTFLVTVGALAY
jgi:hypothetical protein